MSEFVFARKYRPKTLDEVIGQPVVVRTLSNAIKNNKLHHAYMLVGQFGSGKTTVARILAAMENCEVSPGVKPCGKCSICRHVFEGTHADIIEIDAASEAGKVEQIRVLKKEALYNPVDGAKTKYFIIDECHSMSGGSNEALLKLLEEPPAHTRFVLCTTDVQKVRPTIVSRCQRHDFIKIFWMQIAETLQQICKEEGIDAEVGALNLCARLARGSMRNGLNNLEKLISFVGNGSISTSDAEKSFGAVDEMLYSDLMDEVVGVNSTKPDSAKAFLIINKMLREGAEYQTISNGLAEYLQTLMIGLTSSKAGDLVHLSQEGKNRLKQQMKQCAAESKLNAIMKSIECLTASNVAVGYGIEPEVALQKWFVESIFEFRKK